jgi:hypothetical protein
MVHRPSILQTYGMLKLMPFCSHLTSGLEFVALPQSRGLGFRPQDRVGTGAAGNSHMIRGALLAEANGSAGLRSFGQMDSHLCAQDAEPCRSPTKLLSPILT